MAAQIDRTTLSLILSGRTVALDLDSFTSDDWALLVKEAEAEGVAPLVYWELSKSGKISSLPKQISNHLRAIYFSTRMKNEQSIAELKTLVAAFDQADIPVVALKGICFALTIYPDIGLRPMVDLDLLVPASKISEAVEIAKTFGYVETVPEVFPGLNKLLGDEICLRKTGSPFVVIELHNSLLVNKSFTYAVPVDWFWEQTERLDSSSLVVHENLGMLTPTAQLLYAAGHAVLKHGGRNTALRWYFDLDRLIRFFDLRMDWDLFLKQAEAFQWGSALDVALSETYKYFNTPIPNHVLAALSQTVDSHRNLIARKDIQTSSRILEEYQNLLARNWFGRFILLLGLVMPGPAYMRWRYGLKSNWGLPLWYLYRWWGIFKDMLQTLFVLFHNIKFSRGHEVEHPVAGDPS